MVVKQTTFLPTRGVRPPHQTSTWLTEPSHGGWPDRAARPRQTAWSSRATPLKPGHLQPLSCGPMEVALLGPLEIRVGGRIIPVTAPKERAVVSVLALRDGGVVTSRELIAALWGEEPPRSAAKALQTYVSNLRRILPENSIVTASGGYALVTDGVDTVHFDALAVTGRRRLAEGDNPAAVEVLREALGLWRGQGFTELTESPFGAPWATRLQELRRACEEDLVDARLAAGDERPPVAELEMAVAAEPLRERRWAQLMLALYRDGRQADALRTFERLRTLLAEEIGIDPSAELRALEAAILVQDPSLLQTPARGQAGRRYWAPSDDDRGTRRAAGSP